MIAKFQLFPYGRARTENANRRQLATGQRKGRKMHPFWLTFRDPCLEHAYLERKTNLHLANDRHRMPALASICTVSNIFNVAKAYGMFSANHIWHFTCLCLPSLVGTWVLHRLGPRAARWRRTIVFSVWLMVCPVCIMSIHTWLPKPHTYPWFLMRLTNKWKKALIEAFVLPCGLLFAGGLVLCALVLMTLPLQFKDLFWTQTAGCLVSMTSGRYVNSVLTSASEGRLWVKKVGNLLDCVSGLVFGVEQAQPERAAPPTGLATQFLFFCYIMLAFLVPLVVTWWLELQSRENFLRELKHSTVDVRFKKVVQSESLIDKTGQSEFSADLTRMGIMGVWYVLVIAAVLWKIISAVFRVAEGTVWGEWLVKYDNAVDW